MKTSLRSFIFGLSSFSLALFALFSLTSFVFAQGATCLQSNINRLNGCVYNSTTPGAGTFLGNIDPGRGVPAAGVPVADSFTFLDVFWGPGGPFSLSDNFSVRWSGIFTFTPGTYRFYAGSDDGIRIKIGDTTYLDKFTPRIYKEDQDSFQVTFCQQTTVPVQVDYFEAAALAQVKARWVKVPAPFDQMQGCLWSGKDPGSGSFVGAAPSGPAAPVPVPDNFAPLEYWWNNTAPAGATLHNFSGRWSSYFLFSPGTYRFLAGSGDGLRIKMATAAAGQQVGALQTVIDHFEDRVFTDNIFVRTFTEPTVALIQLDYYDAASPADVLFRWDKVIPCSAQTGNNQFLGCLYDGTDPTTGAVAGFALPGKLPPSSPISQAFTALDFQDAHVISTPFTGPRTFSAKWSGNFTFAPGTYRFTAGSDDGMRVYFNGQKVIDGWQDRPYSENTYIKTFSSETTVKIDIDYYENLVLARANFRWEPIFDCSASTVGFGVLKGCLYDWTSSTNPPADFTSLFSLGPAQDGRALSNPVPQSAVAIDLRDSNFLRMDKFAGVWRGVFHFPAGQYRFYAGSDDGVRVRVDLNDGAGYQDKLNKLVDRVYTEDSFTLTLAQDQDIKFELDFYDRIGPATLKFGWDPIPVCTTEVGVNQMTGCLYDWLGTTPPTRPEDGVPAGNAPSGPVFSGSAAFSPLDVDWGVGPASPFTGIDYFSARWRGNFVLPAGNYRFSVGSDDGVRVKVNGVTKIDRWIPRIYQVDQDVFTQTFDGVTPVLIEVEYFDQGAFAKIKMNWQKL